MLRMSQLFRSVLRSIRHPENSGQAIIVLALGFIGLVGFVGIVTDVSILLARYNTLSRAVDSAAISAAKASSGLGMASSCTRDARDSNTAPSPEVPTTACPFACGAQGAR